MDFSIIVQNNLGLLTPNIEKIVKRSFEMGYECVAINTIVNPADLTGKNINIPNPKLISFEGKFGRKFRILNRLTAIAEDPIHAHNMLKHPIAKKYDILAVQPVGEKMLHHVTTQIDVDIICLNLSGNLGYTLKKTHIGPAFQKGMCFEISYSPCFKSQDNKRNIISNSLHLVNLCKGRNIIISSGASSPLDLRSPEDVVNLSLLFGLKTNQGVDAVRKSGHSVMSHAGTRNSTGCGFVSITGCMRIPKQQGWIVKLCKVPPLSTSVSSESAKRKLESENDTFKYKKVKIGNKN